MSKRTIGIVIGIIVAAVGFWYLTQPAEETKAEPTNHTTGTGSIVLIEYGDFECPACGAYHPILQQLKAVYSEQVTFQFRHFPLEAIHKNARAASRAAEAAAAQGKFWEMHDFLFENQNSWKDTNDPISIFEGYARNIGVPDIAKFTEDYRSSTINALINADLDAGRAIGATSTPTFVLEGKKLDENPATPSAFADMLDEAIKAKGGTPPVRPEESATDQTQLPDATQENSTPAEEQPSQ